MSTQPSRLVLTLYYVSGHEPSRRAQDRLLDLLESSGGLDYELEMVDLGDQPDRAEAERILACPTIVRSSPGPVRRIVGDLGQTRLVREAIGLA